jgi:3-phenylpropionate/trans-cinnamate dioxygenase ferredoxin subunit
MEWIRVFPSSAEARQRIAENRPQLVVIRGKRICLVKLDEKFYAVQDACTHNQESLSKGTVNYIGEIVCPLHGYRFNLQNGRESAERSVDLEIFPIREDETGFYIGL